METSVEATSPVVRRVRAYFAPVDRATSTPAAFDAAQTGWFALDAPPAPWLDLGWVTGFKRASGTKIEAVRTGAPAVTQMQVRTEVEAEVALEFATWGKLQLALAAGTQQMNLLRAGVEATPLLLSSTAAVLQVGAAASAFAVGDHVVVDADYAGETGYLGAGVSGAYLRIALSDVDYVRRVSLNVGRIASIADGALTLETPLLAGVPSAGMKVCGVVGFCDREGSSFFQEWSALFVLEGQQGDRVVVQYPRLQAMQGASESAVVLGELESVRLAARFRALPVRDAVDGEQVLCFRSYLPA